MLVDRLTHFPDPVVITGGVEYLEIWYHMPATARSRALYLVDPYAELAENRGDSVAPATAPLRDGHRCPLHRSTSSSPHIHASGCTRSDRTGSNDR